MARTLNFDAVVVETVDVTKRGVTYTLRDDVPMPIMVRAFGLQEQQLALRAIEAPTIEQTEAWLAETQAQTLALCGAIFRHSLPEMTDAEIAEIFSFEEQTQLVMLFFTIRSAQLSRQVNALSGSSPNQPTPGETANQPESLARASSATASRQKRGEVGATTRRKR